MSRPRRYPKVAPLSALPPAPRVRVYEGPEHGDARLAELEWRPSDGLAGAAAFLPWLKPAHLLATTLPVYLTLYDAGGTWRPSILVTDSCAVPGELGVYAASSLHGGELVGAMQDGALLSHSARRFTGHGATVPAAAMGHYVYELARPGGGWNLYDGAACRAGGVKRANDPRGTGRTANAELHCDGLLHVRQWSTIPRLSAGASRSDWRAAEILWDYGPAFSIAGPP